MPIRALWLLPRSFRVMIAAQWFSRIGDFAQEVIFVLLALELADNHYLLIGVTYFVRFVPYLLLGPLGGVIADIFNKRYMMLFADMSRCLITLVLAGAYFTGSLTIVGLMFFGGLQTVFRTLFQPAFQAASVTLLTRSQFIHGNSLSEMSEQSASIIGPLLSALCLTYTSKGTVILLDALTFLLSLICIASASLPPAAINTRHKISLYKLYQIAWQQLRHLKTTPRLWHTIFYSALCIFLAGALLRFILPAHILAITHHEVYVGYAMTLMAAGAFLGAYLCTKLRQPIPVFTLFLYWALYGSIFLMIALSHDIYGVALLILLLGIIGAAVDIVLVCNIQTESKQSTMGKNFALFSTFANTAEAFSGIISGLMGMLSIHATFITMSALLFAIPAYHLITSFRKQDGS